MCALIAENVSSIGLKSGEYGGKNIARIPLLVIESDPLQFIVIKLPFFNHFNDCLILMDAAVIHDDHRVGSRVQVHDTEESIYKLSKTSSVE